MMNICQSLRGCIVISSQAEIRPHSLWYTWFRSALILEACNPGRATNGRWTSRAFAKLTGHTNMINCGLGGTHHCIPKVHSWVKMISLSLDWMTPKQACSSEYQGYIRVYYDHQLLVITSRYSPKIKLTYWFNQTWVHGDAHTVPSRDRKFYSDSETYCRRGCKS